MFNHGKVSEIVVVFQNCECVIIPTSVIVNLRFSTIGENFHIKDDTLLSRKKLSYLYFRIDYLKAKDAITHFENQLCFVPKDKLYSLERLKGSSDISGIVVNNVEYTVPWCKGNAFDNAWQSNSLVNEDKRPMFSVTIRDPMFT